jgi:hypothetical protein
MPNTINAQPTPAAIALHILEHGNWQNRGLAAHAMTATPVVHIQTIQRPRRDNGRFRSTRSDIAFNAA